MAKKKCDLTKQELEFIGKREATVASVLDAIKDATKFKQGDYLIAFEPGSAWRQRRLITNSYGAPKKYVVVHTDKNGVNYMKELNKKGNPIGQLITPMKFDGGGFAHVAREYEFEVDPDYTDAIIMADEDNYDAAIVHRVKGDLFKEITKHNKSLKVKVNDPQTLIDFLKNLKVGDVLWRSIKTYITITQIDPIPTTHNGKRLDESKPFGKAIDSKGKEVNLVGWYFKYSAIYTGRPRSYNELKDPK